MGNNEFLNWLFSDAGAGWIFGILSLAGSIITLYLLQINRNKPAKVVCKITHRISLIKIAEKAREKIAITFNRKRVKELAQVEVEIFNSGSVAVQNAVVDIIFSEDTKVLDLSYEAKPENFRFSCQITQSNCAQLNIPFLNSADQHRHTIFIKLVCDGSVDDVKFVGGGIGWSVEPYPILSRNTITKKMHIAKILTATIGFAAIGFVVFLFGKWGVVPFGEEGNPDFNFWLDAGIPLLIFYLLVAGIGLWSRSNIAWPFSNTE